jgi:bacterioferritin-associated ferredoxin
MTSLNAATMRTVLTIILIRVQIRTMIICICKAVSDRHIRAAVSDGVTSMRQLTCGKCVPEARAALSSAIAQCQRAAAQDVSVAAGAAASPFPPARAVGFAL